MNISHKCQFGNLIFKIRDVKGIWKLDFQLDGKRQRPSMEMLATKDNLQIIKERLLPDLYLELTGRKVDPIALQIQVPKSVIFSDIAEVCLKQQKHDIEAHVLNAKELILKREILPIFGKRRIESISAGEIRTWQNDLADRVCIGTIKKYRGVLSQIFDYAWMENIITENIIKKAKLPKNANPKVKRTEMLPFNEDEISTILRNAEGSFRWFLQFSFFSGIRPGEAVTLDWSDICFEAKKISITKTIKRKSKDDDGWVVGKPKTKASIRKVDMLPQVEEALRAQFLETGLKNGRIFLNAWNIPWASTDRLNTKFKALLKNVAILQRNLYNTRHTFASQMLVKKIDIGWISKTMGHENIQITLQTYAKYIPQNNDEREAFLKEFVTLFVTPKEKMA